MKQAIAPPIRRTALISVDPRLARIVERCLRRIDLEPFHVKHWSEAVEHHWDVDAQCVRRRLMLTVLDLRSRREARLRGYRQFVLDYGLLTGCAEPRVIALGCATHVAALREAGSPVETVMLDPGRPSSWPVALDRALAGPDIELGVVSAKAGPGIGATT